MSFARTAVAALAVAASGVGAHAQAIDIRNCPLDTLTFVDPWAGGSFIVKKVGTDYTFICPEGFQPPDEMCSGPYGYLVLQGVHQDSSSASPVQKTAIYSVIKGVPCCDWSVEEGVSSVVAGKDFKWLGPSEVPKLRELPFLSIESQYAEDFGNPYFAAACRL